jgi:hypothetical protein
MSSYATLFLAVFALPNPTIPIASASNPVRAKIPGQTIEVSLEVPDFVAEKIADPEGTLIAGRIRRDVRITLTWEENFPHVSSEDRAGRVADYPSMKAFAVEGTACREIRLQHGNVLLETSDLAFPTTADFRFVLEVVVGNTTAEDLLGGTHGTVKFTREEFARIVKSLKSSGTVDRAALALPAEAYAFRDEAAAQKGDPLAWTRRQCDARKDDWAPQLYLAAIARELDKSETALPACSRALELLAAVAPSTPKHVFATGRALDVQAWALRRQKKFKEAIPVSERVVKLGERDETREMKALRAESLYWIACCLAKTSQPADALARLREAIQADPSLKVRARSEEYLESLRANAEFKKLVDED